MSAFLTLDAVTLAAPDGRPLLSDLTLSFGRERTGLVGRNGCGKTTLLAAMAGRVPPKFGAIRRFGTVALLHQDWADDAITLAQALGVADGLALLRRLAEGRGSATDAAEADWGLEDRIIAALAEAALPGLDLDRQLASLSGGERTRVALARVLIEAPDLLLLDEPTNNLDRAGRDMIRRLVAAWGGGLVVASHDRALLEEMDRIVELTGIGSTVFGGGWSAFKAARDAARAGAEADLAQASTALHRTERALQQQRERQAQRDRQGREHRAKGGQSKLSLNAQQERSERTGSRSAGLADRLTGAAAGLAAARARVEGLTPLRIDLPPTHLPAGSEVLRFEAVSFERGGAGGFSVRSPSLSAGRSAWRWSGRMAPARPRCCSWRRARWRRAAAG